MQFKTKNGYPFGHDFNPRGNRRNPTTIICFHHSVAPNNRPTARQAENIVDFHMSPKPAGRAWQSGGYNDVIEQDGTLVQLISTLAHGAHLGRLNSRAHGICIVGDGRHSGFFNEAQQATAIQRVRALLAMPEYAGAEIGGHRDYNEMSGAPSECPAYDFAAWWLRVNAPPPDNERAEELEVMIEDFAQAYAAYLEKWGG